MSAPQDHDDDGQYDGEYQDDGEDDSDGDEVGVVLRIDDVDDPVRHLLRGEIEVEGRMPYSSNATFLVHVIDEGRSHPAIYKPVRGERPLWDFEPGLHRREVATYLMSESLGFGVIPPTVLRDGPFGEGSVQWFVDADHSQHYFTIHETHPELHDALRRMALLDVIANNTDRKSGHVLLIPARDGEPASIWGIDNGLCFAAEDKLRTVIWEFGGERIPEGLLARLEPLRDAVPLDVAALLSDDEVEAVQRRARRCLESRRFPTDPTGRRYPWPLV